METTGIMQRNVGALNMDNQKALNQLDNIQNNMVEKYPKFQLLTNKNFVTIIEMLSIDYKSVSPGGKRLHIFKKYMQSILKESLDNKCHKNYMMDLINIFNDPVISKHLYDSFDNRSDELMAIVRQLKGALFAWQGFEGCEWKRFERIEKILR